MKILTFNMAHLVGVIKHGSTGKTRNLMLARGVDIALLQEGVGLFGWDSIESISTGWDCRTIRMEKRFWGGWKLGILSKFKIMHWDEYVLGYPDANGWRRSILGACLNGGIKAVSVHLGHSQHLEQIQKTLSFLDSLPTRYPVFEIIGGDFNYKENGYAWNVLKNEGFSAVGWDGVDGIWVRSKASLAPQPEVVLQGASDVHNGVLVTL